MKNIINKKLTLLALLSSLLIINCINKRALTTPPSGDGWRVMNQSYKYISETIVSTYNNYNLYNKNYYRPNTYYNTYVSKQKILIGSLLESDKKQSSQGYNYIFDCKNIPKVSHDSTITPSKLTTNVNDSLNNSSEFSNNK